MQFCDNGIVIPDELETAHAEGRVVFIAGAGVSMDAGLPGFDKLALAIRETLKPSAPMPEDMLEAHESGDYENFLSQLEGECSPDPQRPLMGRGKVLNAMKDLLQNGKCNNGGNADDCLAHRALLDLSWSDTHGYRLVTTNFDWLFSTALEQAKENADEHVYPSLPDPARAWSGIVHLHGKIPPDGAEIGEGDYRHYVLTSADFGRAYAGEFEGQAGKFIQRLFRQDVKIVFVGYSLGDRFVRNLLDAIQYDQKESQYTGAGGKLAQKFYIFQSYDSEARKKKTEKTWRRRGVEAIMYHAPKIRDNEYDHTALKRTLIEWGKLHRAPEECIGTLDASRALPILDEVKTNKLMWGIAHERDGHEILERFVRQTPAPSLEWFFCMSKHARTKDLIIGGGHAGGPKAGKSWTLAHWMLDNHLTDIRFISWYFANHPELNPIFKGRFEFLVRGKIGELHGDPKNAKAVYLWTMHAAGRVLLGSGGRFDREYFQLKLPSEKNSGDLPHDIRLWVENRIKPMISGVKSDATTDAFGLPTTPWEVTLNCNSGDAQNTIGHLLSVYPNSAGDLAKMLQQLLEEAIELRESEWMIAQRGVISDAIFGIPSIALHSQNQPVQHKWLDLVYMVRDAWQALHLLDSAMAQKMAVEWMGKKHYLFYRLALHAASFGAVPGGVWLDWLLAEGGAILHNSLYKPELHLLLREQGGNLDASQLDRLVAVLLEWMGDDWRAGDIDNEKAGKMHSVWAKLWLLREAGAAIGAAADEFMAFAKSEFPRWEYKDSTRFISYMEIGWGPTDEERAAMPKTVQDVPAWLRKMAGKELSFEYDAWRECVARAPFGYTHAVLDVVLSDQQIQSGISREIIDGLFNAVGGIASEQLQSGDNEKILEKLARLPREWFKGRCHAIARWLKFAAKHGLSDNGHTLLLRLCIDLIWVQRISVETSPSESGAMLRAYNSIAGMVTLALIEQALQLSQRKKHKGIPEDISDLLTELLSADGAGGEDAAYILYSHLMWLLPVDRAWVLENLEPTLLAWDNNTAMAQLAWGAVLETNKFSWEFIVRNKCGVFGVVRNADRWFAADKGFYGNRIKNLAHLVYLILTDNRNSDDFTLADENKLMAGCDFAMIAEIFAVMNQIMRLNDAAEEVFSGRIKPLVEKHILARLQDMDVDRENAEYSAVVIAMANIAILSGAKHFPGAVRLFGEWLMPLSDSKRVYWEMAREESSICAACPDAALELIEIILPKDGSLSGWEHGDVRACLQTIVESKPELEPRARLVENRLR